MSAASSSSSGKEPKLKWTLAPLPTTRRGYGIPIYAHPKEAKIIYTNGKLVVVRSLANPAESITFSEHKCNVNVAQFSPSGFWVASGDEEGNVIIWSYPQMKVKNTFKIGKTVNDLDWDESSTRIVAVGDGSSGKAKVFSWDSGNSVGEILMHSQQILAVSYRKQRPFKIATGSEDLTVNFYEGPPFKFVTSYKGHARYPNNVKYSPNGDYFLSVGADSKVVLFDGKDGKVLKESEGKDQAEAHKGNILSFAWSPDSKQILTVSADKTAKLWTVPELTVTKTFTFGNETNDQQVGAVWTGDYLITVSLSGAINYLDVNNTAQPKKVLHGHQANIESLSLNISEGTFYTSGLNGEISRWDFASGDAVWLTGSGHGGRTITSVNVIDIDRGDALFSFGLDDRVRFSELKSGEVSADGSDLGGQPVASAASKKDAKLAVAVLAQGKAVVLRGNQVASTTNLGWTPQSVTFNHDDSKVIIGSKESKKPKLQVFKIAGDKLTEAESFGEHDKAIHAIAANAHWIASVDKEASIYIRDTGKGELKTKSGWRFHQAAVNTAAWNPSGTLLATGSLDTNIIFWKDFKEFNSGERVRVERAHPYGVDKLAFWNDNTLVTVGADKCVRIWDVSTLW